MTVRRPMPDGPSLTALLLQAPYAASLISMTAVLNSSTKGSHFRVGAMQPTQR